MPKQRRSNGGGWSAGPNYVSAGNLINQQYSGVGKDCAGDVVRPGFITSYSGKGLPGLSGGSRRRRVKGGRYEITPGPLIANSAIGMSGPASFSRIPCESSTTNSLNSGLYRATTAVGGRRKTRGGANFPVVNVGAADSMRYNAPNAGYTNTFEALPAGGAVPGFTVQTPYAPISTNPACGMKGGSKRRDRSKGRGSKRRGSKRRGSKRRGSKRSGSKHRDRSKRRVRFGGGAGPVAEQAGEFTPVQLNQITTREAFDGSKGGLPVKFGGGRRTKRRCASKRPCITGKIRKFFGL